MSFPLSGGASTCATHRAFSLTEFLRSDLFARLFLLAAACLCIGDGFPFWGDIGLYFQPLVSLQGAALRGGELALWNPMVYCGAPLTGNAQAWIFYPPAWPMAFFSPPLFLTFFLEFHVFLAGAFCHVFLRRGVLRLGAAASLLGAVVWMLGGYVVSKTQFPNMTAALSWLPLILLFTEKVLRRATFSRALPLAVALAMQILASHAQITAFTIYLALIYAVWWLWISPFRASRVLAKTRNAKRRRQLLGAMALVFVLALSISCAQWLPVLDSLRETSRGMSLEKAQRFFLPLNQLTNFFWPHRFGNPMNGEWRGGGNIWETACYLGIVPFGLALFAICRAAFRAGASTCAEKFAPRLSLSLENRRLSAARFWIFVACLSLILSLGAPGILYALAWLFVPGMRAFHDAARLLMGASLALSILAALSAQHILAKQKTPRAKALCGAFLVLFALLDLGLYARNFYPKRPFFAAPVREYSPLPLIQNDEFVRRGEGRVFMPDSENSWWSFASPLGFGENSARRYAKWQATLTPNIGATHGLREAGGYEPLSNASIKTLTQGAREMLQPDTEALRGATQNAREYSRHEKMRRAVLRTLAVRYVILFRAEVPRFPSLAPVFVSPPRGIDGERTIVLRNDDFAPRLRWLSPQEENVARETGKYSQAKSFVEREAATLPRFTRDGFNMGEISIPPQGRARTLLFSDTFAPGWQLFVDGRARPIDRHGTFRAVLFSPSRASRRAVFVYRPEAFSLGVFVSLCAMFGVAFSIFARRRATKSGG